MAKFYLINTTTVRGQKYFAGDEIDDASDPKASIVAAGGICWPQGTTAIDTQALLVQKLRLTKAINEAACDALMIGAAAASEAVAAAASAAAAAASAASIPTVQSGTGTLATGTVTISGVTLTANSRIICTMKDPGAGAITGMAGLDAPAASRNTGTGQFVVNAIDDTKATIATAVCTFDYVIIG